MAITFVSAANADDGSNDDVTVLGSELTGMQNDDVMFAFYAGHGDLTDSALPLSLPDFTEIDTRYNSSGTDHTVGCWYKVADNESGDYAFSGSHPGTPETAAHIIVLRGVDTASPLDVTFTSSHYVKDQDAGTTPQAQPITTSTNEAWVLLFCHTLFTQTTDMGEPTNYTNRSTIVANQRNTMVCSREITTAGLETPGAFAHTGTTAATESGLYTLAVKPAATGGGGGADVPIINIYHEHILGHSHNV